MKPHSGLDRRAVKGGRGDRRGRGQFLAVEGLAGAGKTTLVRALAMWLDSERIPHVETREPGGTVIGEKIRRLVLEPTNSMNAWSEALLFEADRAETIAEVVGPAVAMGKVVVSDRSLYGTIAYQSFGRGLDLGAVEFITGVAMAGLYPDLVILLDVDPGVAKDRASRKRGMNRFDVENAAFQARVRRGFLWAADRDGDKALVIDASKAPEGVASDAIRAVAHLLGVPADGWSGL